jgi:hypothetical protein
MLVAVKALKAKAKPHKNIFGGFSDTIPDVTGLP